MCVPMCACLQVYVCTSVCMLEDTWSVICLLGESLSLAWSLPIRLDCLAYKCDSYTQCIHVGAGIRTKVLIAKLQVVVGPDAV